MKRDNTCIINYSEVSLPRTMKYISIENYKYCYIIAETLETCYSIINCDKRITTEYFNEIHNPIILLFSDLSIECKCAYSHNIIVCYIKDDYGFLNLNDLNQ